MSLGSANSSSGTLGLAAKNHQDLPLTCKPEKTFFKQRSPRHTNFQTLQLTQSLGSNGCALIGNGRTAPRSVQTVFQRSSDLVGPTYVVTNLPALNTTTNLLNTDAILTPHATGVVDPLNTGGAPSVPNLVSGEGLSYVDEVAHFIVQHAEIVIGSQTMDELYNHAQYAEWHARQTDEKLMAHAIGIGSTQERIDRAFSEQVVWSPLCFWYTRSASQYLPAIAAQGHDIVYKMDGVAANDMWGGHGKTSLISDVLSSGNLSPSSIPIINESISASGQQMVYDGVFLDRAERMMFAKMAQEYLISQFQYITQQSVTEGTAQISLKNVSFNHPMRHFAVMVRRKDYVQANADLTLPADALTPYQNGSSATQYKSPQLWNDFSAGPQIGTGERLAPLTGMQLKINNYDRLLTGGNIGPYYNEVHQSQKVAGHTYETFVYMYHFGQYGFGTCSSGSLNMSAIDNVEVNLTRAINPVSKYVPDGLGAVTAVAAVYPAADVFLYGDGVNVLKFVSGMAGTAYAN
jgi:hypothetical protein